MVAPNSTRLASLGRLVFTSFHDVLAVLDPSSSSVRVDETDSESHALFLYEYERFHIWTVDLGLLVPAHGSLDYRLREADRLAHTFEVFLADLNQYLQETLQLKRSQTYQDDGKIRLSTQPSTPSQQAQFDESVLEDSSDEEDLQPQQHLRLLLDSVREVIDGLFRLSTRIRNPATRLASSKAKLFQQIDVDSGVDLIKAFGHYDHDYVLSLFAWFQSKAPGEARTGDLAALWPTDSQADLWHRDEDCSLCEARQHVAEQAAYAGSEDQEEEEEEEEPTCSAGGILASFLIHRIARANNQRRQQFGYWKHHRSNLVKHTQATLERTFPLVPANAEPANLNPGHQGATPAVGRQALKLADLLAPPTVTTATRLQPAVIENMDAMSVTSVSEYAPSSWAPDRERIQFPPPPKISPAEKFFECPYCFTICPRQMLSEKAWKAHLIHDLRPYICTYPDCKSAGQLYDTRSDWIEHENTFHRKQWRCPAHSDELYPTLKAFKEHMEMHHPADIDLVSSQTYLRSCESFSASADRPCPICLFSAADARSLHSHIALHLERFSLFSLPRGAGDDEKDDVGSDVAVDAVQHSRDDESELSVDIGDEWDNLEEAVRMGDVERIEYILRDQATETDSHSTKVDNALIEAAKTGDIDVVKTLLEHGATVRAPTDFYDDTALMAAASENHSDVLRLLLRHGAVVDASCGARTALSAASEYGRVEAARTLIEHGADVNFLIGGYPAAMEAAAAQNEIDVAKVLVENGADLIGLGASPLGRASASGHLEMVDFLLTAGTPAVGNEEQRPLHNAAGFGHDKVVARLLEAGADVNARAVDGRTALHDAVTSGNSRCVQLLLEAGADPNITNKGRETPLHVASRDGHEEAVGLLIAAGADLEITNRVSGTALQAAAKAGNPHIVEILRTAGAQTEPKEYSMSSLMGEHLSVASHASRPQAIDVPRAWDVQSVSPDTHDLKLTLLQDIVQDSMVASVNFSVDGKYIIIGCRRGAKVYEVDNIASEFELIHNIQGDAEVYVRSASFSPDNRLVATAADDGMVVLWDFDTRKINTVLMESDGIGTYHVAFAPDGKKLAMACGDGTVQLYTIENPNRQLWHFDDGVAALAFSPDGLMLAVGTLDHNLFVCEPRDPGQQPCKLQQDGHQNSVLSVAFSSSGKKIYTGSLDCTAKAWEIVEVDPSEIKYQTSTMPGHEVSTLIPAN
ncbi:hypothetical protein KCU88_g3711, partial [Aureobasidium melanogenum]